VGLGMEDNKQIKIMKKIIAIAIIVLTLTSCGSLQFGRVDSNWTSAKGSTNCPSFK